MNFTVRKQLAKCRTGILKVGIKEIETPGCSLYTRSGTVPHLTSDVLRTIADLPSAVHLSVQATIDHPGVETTRKVRGCGIKKFLGLEEFITYLSIQDPTQELREGYNEQKCVSVFTPGGRRKIDVNQFIALLEVFQPDIAECLCDTVLASKQTEKRIRKSVDRTLIFLDQCIDEMAKKALDSCNLLGVIEGSSSEKERIRSARETSQRPVCPTTCHEKEMAKPRHTAHYWSGTAESLPSCQAEQLGRSW